MFRNDVVMTPLRVKQAIDSRFTKPSEDELNVLINGTWVEFTKVIDEPGPGQWYDTLGFTEFTLNNAGAAKTNGVPYTTQELIDITPFHVKWVGTLTDVETGEVPGDGNVNVRVQMKNVKLNLQPGNDYEIIIQSSQIPVVPGDDSFDFQLSVLLTSKGLSTEVLVDGYFEIRENDTNGVVLGHYPLQCTLKGDCYLTSAMVGYYGKPDDGIELTAMRRLREVYAVKHEETLKTYYADSAIIISEIERLGMEDHYYGRIKDVVDEIVIHVNNENWSVAEGLYLGLYYGLKEELM